MCSACDACSVRNACSTCRVCRVCNARVACVACVTRLRVVEEDEVNVIETKLLEKLLDGLRRAGAGVEARDQLRRHEDLAAPHATLHRGGDALADGAVVQVDLTEVSQVRHQAGGTSGCRLLG